MALSLSGLASGFDWQSLVDQLTEVERLPQRRLLGEQNTLQEQLNSYNSIKTQLSVLQNRMDLLKDPDLFESRKSSSSDTALATATAAEGTPSGSYSIDIQQMATRAYQQSAANAGKAIHTTNDVSSLLISQMPLATAITSGRFTVNGKTITVDSADSLQDVFDRINTATGGNVSASYDSSTDTITFSGASEIVLGSATDNEKIKKAIDDFIAEYNKVQSTIDSQTASTTDSEGKVTAGPLQGESQANAIATELRSLIYSQIPGLTGSLNHLERIGIVTNGNDNTINLSDPSKLDAALANNLSDLKSLFTDSTHGVAVNLSGFIEKTIGEDGTLLTRTSTLDKQSSDIDSQIESMERIVQSRRQQLINSFIAMEKAQAQINQQLSFLNQRFGSASLIPS